jgi:uncharacterized membrane protein YgcG
LGVALFQPPPIRGHVNDLAKKLTPAERAGLEQKLNAVNAQTGNELAVLVLPSLSSGGSDFSGGGGCSGGGGASGSF